MSKKIYNDNLGGEIVTEEKTPDITEKRLAHLFSIGLFLFLFVFFVYGALFIALLGLSDWIIHKEKFDFFLSHGIYGVFLFALSILLIWFLCAYLVSLLFYFIFSFFGGKRLARRVSIVVFFVFFHIFSIPWILWPSLRDNIPSMRKKYRNKLKNIAKKARLKKQAPLT